MDEQDIVSRDYLIGTCFLCQICLRCKVDQTFLDCDCELEKLKKKPVKKSKNNNFNSRKFDPTSNTLKEQQILLLKEKSRCYGYGFSFTKSFSFSLCSACNSNFHRSKYKIHTTLPTQESTAITTTHLNQEFIAAATTAQLNQESTAAAATTTAQSTMILSDVDSPNSPLPLRYAAGKPFEINFKLIIKTSEGKSKFARFSKSEATTLFEFEDDVEELVQDQWETAVARKEYNLSYKKSKTNDIGIGLFDEDDWERFLNEYKSIAINRKVLEIIVTMKARKDDDVKKLKHAR